jgi:hypothetical protein
MSVFRRAPHFKAITVACVLGIYLVYLWAPDWFSGDNSYASARGNVQFAFPDEGQHGEVRGGDTRKAERVMETMRRTFWKYRIRSWGFDDIKPISGGQGTTRYVSASIQLGSNSRNPFFVFLLNELRSLATAGVLSLSTRLRHWRSWACGKSCSWRRIIS